MENTTQNKKTDPIPHSVKSVFWADKEMPNFTRDYEAIGFDADHCLVKYDVRAVITLLARLQLEDLYKHGYPREVMNFNCVTELEVCMNYSVWDIDTGCVLKLGENKEILAAMKGKKVLTKAQICEIYKCENPKLNHLEWPDLHKFDKASGNFWTFSTYFDCCKVPQVIMGVEMIDSGKLLGKTYQDLSVDMRRTVYRQYIHIKEDGTVLPAHNYGDFFPELFKNPQKYIIAQPELRAIFQKMRDQGKFIFLGTNSHYEYMELIMKATLGDDWRNYFNMVFCFCRKPHFFNAYKPMYFLDTNEHDFNGKQIQNWKELVENDSNVTYMEGNVALLNDFLKEKYKKEDIKVAFFGDQYTSDCSWSNTVQGWDGIVVIEELTQCEDYEHAPDLEKIDPKLLAYDRYWGNYFFHDAEKTQKNYFVKKVAENSRYAVPMVRHITSFIH